LVSLAGGQGEFAGKTIVSYQAQPILAIELPIAADASGVELDTLGRRVEYRTTRDRTSLAAFYREAYRAVGLSETTPNGGAGDVLIFGDRDGTRLAVHLDELAAGERRVASGGQITVIAVPPGGVSGASGVLLDGGDEGQVGDNGVFTILPKARGITRG
jgi:hypothetical protein